VVAVGKLGLAVGAVFRTGVSGLGWQRRFMNPFAHRTTVASMPGGGDTLFHERKKPVGFPEGTRTPCKGLQEF